MAQANLSAEVRQHRILRRDEMAIMPSCQFAAILEVRVEAGTEHTQMRVLEWQAFHRLCHREEGILIYLEDQGGEFRVQIM